jgi:hypothetical protein
MGDLPPWTRHHDGMQVAVKGGVCTADARHLQRTSGLTRCHCDSEMVGEWLMAKQEKASDEWE